MIGVIGAALTATLMAQAKDGHTEWIGNQGERIKARVYTSQSLGTAPILVAVLHGDAPFNKPSYQYVFASRAAENIRNAVVAALLRPGYTDGDNDRSDGARGNATADNYTPEIVDRLAAAIQVLRSEHHARVVVLVGHSGGAAIAADILARRPQLAQAALLVSCPCNVPAFREHMKSVSPTPLWDAPVHSLSPIDGASSVAPQVHVRMAVGENDPVAPPKFTQEYAAALQRRGIDVHVSLLPGLGHEILLEPAVMAELQALATID